MLAEGRPRATATFVFVHKLGQSLNGPESLLGIFILRAKPDLDFPSSFIDFAHQLYLKILFQNILLVDADLSIVSRSSHSGSWQFLDCLPGSSRIRRGEVSRTYCIYPQEPWSVPETKLCQCIIEILPDREYIIFADDMVIGLASAPSIGQRIELR
jgi:hypothetical protein